MTRDPHLMSRRQLLREIRRLLAQADDRALRLALRFLTPLER